MLGNCNATPTIAVKDLATARKFYEETLGLPVDSEVAQAQMVIYKSGNGTVQIYVTPAAGSNQATYVTWEVEGIEDVVADLTDKGVTFEEYPDLSDTEVQGGVHTMGGEKGAWFKDPDGNVLCLHAKAS